MPKPAPLRFLANWLFIPMQAGARFLASLARIASRGKIYRLAMVSRLADLGVLTRLTDLSVRTWLNKPQTKGPMFGSKPKISLLSFSPKGRMQ